MERGDDRGRGESHGMCGSKEREAAGKSQSALAGWGTPIALGTEGREPRLGEEGKHLTGFGAMDRSAFYPNPSSAPPVFCPCQRLWEDSPLKTEPAVTNGHLKTFPLKMSRSDQSGVYSRPARSAQEAVFLLAVPLNLRTSHLGNICIFKFSLCPECKKCTWEMNAFELKLRWK